MLICVRIFQLIGIEALLLWHSIESYCTDPGVFEDGYRNPSYTSQYPYMPVDGKINYYCEKGKHIIGPDILVCTKDGWSPSDRPPACLDCPNPPIINHAMYQYERYDSQIGPYNPRVVEYKCMDGYTFQEPQARTLQCISKSWVGKRPSCVQKAGCSPPVEIKNGEWYYIFANHTYGVGTKIKYKCNDQSFRLDGDEVIECRTTGWSGYPPHCTLMDVRCADPGPVANGQYQCETGRCTFEIGSRLQFICEDGYERDGEYTITCRSNGRWSGTIPRCTIPTTSFPPESDTLTDNLSTMTIVIITSCTVLGVLLITMIIVAFQRRKPKPRLCHPIPPPPPYSPYHCQGAVPEIQEEHDRLALIAYADAQSNNISLPSYDEAIRGRGTRTGAPLARLVAVGVRGPHEYRHLPSVPPNFRRQPSGELAASPQTREPDAISRHSTITTSTMNHMMGLDGFGSIDTMNVSDGTSTSVTVDTYDSGASMPSLATVSRRGRAGSLESTASLINEDSDRNSGAISPPPPPLPEEQKEPTGSNSACPSRKDLRTSPSNNESFNP